MRIAPQGVKTGPSESLSFDAYDATNAFQSHASLTAQPNGTLAVVSQDLSLQPSQGTAVLGSGGMHSHKLCYKHASCLTLLLHVSLPGVVHNLLYMYYSLLTLTPLPQVLP